MYISLAFPSSYCGELMDSIVALLIQKELFYLPLNSFSFQLLIGEA